jgi:DNA-binding NarL/FixJ family response regulator
MSNTGTSVLWNTAPYSDASQIQDLSRSMWTYYSRVSMSSSHATLAHRPVLSPEARAETVFSGDTLQIEAPPRSGRSGLRPGEAKQRGPFSLTQRELEVLQLLAEGSTNGEMSARLFISPKTTKNHLAAIFQKLDVTNRTQALVRAVVMGLVTID